MQLSTLITHTHTTQPVHSGSCRPSASTFSLAPKLAVLSPYLVQKLQHDQYMMTINNNVVSCSLNSKLANLVYTSNSVRLAMCLSTQNRELLCQLCKYDAHHIRETRQWLHVF